MTNETKTTPKKSNMKRGRKVSPLAKKIRALIHEGKSNQEIIETLRLKHKPQAVYNARYHYNRKQGLAALKPVQVHTPPQPQPVRPSVVVQVPVKPTLWQRVKNFFMGV